MKKNLLFICILLGGILFAQTVFAKGDDKAALKTNLNVLTQGEAIAYPIPDGTTIECYAKRLDGSIDAFDEYNDYFYMKNGKLYSDTMNKFYKPEKKNLMKKVDRVKLTDNGKTIQMYDPLWEWSYRHHIRVVKINKETGEYFAKNVQDNWTWYRNSIATGYCRPIYPNK